MVMNEELAHLLWKLRADHRVYRVVGGEVTNSHASSKPVKPYRTLLLRDMRAEARCPDPP